MNTLHVVTGAGPVGATVALQLAGRGIPVRLLTRSGSGPDHELIERRRVDVSDREALAPHLEGVAAVHHCIHGSKYRASAWRAELPAAELGAARADAVREGPYASAWFAHRDGEGRLTGIEMRGPNYRGFSADGDKSLFRLQLGVEAPTRLTVLEAPIKVMGLAALEGLRTDTLYVGTAGGMGPLTLACLRQEMAALTRHPGAVLVAATDADPAGERYAVRLAELAGEAGLPVERKAPVGHKDWDAVLKARGTTPARPERPRVSSALAAVVRAMQPPEPATPMPWAPAPVSLAERVRAFEERDALRAAEAMAARGRAGAPASPQPEMQQRPPSPSHGAAP